MLLDTQQEESLFDLLTSTPERPTVNALEERVNQILSIGHSDYRKRVVQHANGRLNFACPYCGDSTKDHNKKRGNLYTETLRYLCFNGGCEKSVTFDRMLADFKITVTEGEKAAYAAYAVVGKKRSTRKLTFEEVAAEVNLRPCLVPRKKLMSKMGLREVANVPIVQKYLEKRCQPLGPQFAVGRNEDLFLLNLDADGELVASLQIRPRQKSMKYLTFTGEGLWTKMLKEPFPGGPKEEALTKFFGIFSADLDGTVTLFEGPLDSMLFPNSCGLMSVKNPWPFDCIRRYFLDDDDAGRKKSLQLMKAGESCFMWEAYKRDKELTFLKIKDYNDLVVIANERQIDLKDVHNYFSNDTLDILGL